MPDLTPNPASPLSEERVREYEQMLAAVTPGPWAYDVEGGAPGGRNGIWSAAYSDEEPGICGDFSRAWKLMEYDARFIAASPTIVADLLADRSRLSARVEELTGARDAWREFAYHAAHCVECSQTGYESCFDGNRLHEAAKAADDAEARADA